MQVITEIELLKRIDAFLELHDMAPTTFGRKATGEPQLIDSIRGGRSPSLKVAAKIVDFMDAADRALRDNPPPLELTVQHQEEERELPFAKAPVNRTGASSRTSSKTAGRKQSSGANGSSHSSIQRPGDGTSQTGSCSVPEAREQ